MKPIRLSRYLVLVLGFFLLFTPSCTRESNDFHADGTKMGPRHDTYDEAIGIFKHMEKDGPGGSDKLHIRTNPPIKHVGKNQKVVSFVTDGCVLAFDATNPSTPAGLFASRPVQDANNRNLWTATVGGTAGVYQYKATCDGTDVEGNSPPIIIVDP